MKYTFKVIGILLVLIIFNENSFAQNSNFSRIGNVNDEIILDKYEDYYLISYEDNSMDSEGGTITFKLSDKESTSKLYEVLKNSFSERNEKPTTVNLKDNEIRIYFKERTLKADYVEIIHEDINTETTGTLPWLTLNEVEKLFGKEE
ncbi:hypothetical protein QYS49_10425 [Marivirga salinae]|uniref:Uncharacterized protein n=1 Tax=Marivirga salinarum TaxID=3059078 RepID=A0AA49GF63_9BACT|nr:hypothetical protein [Marivirga sp. BDSF4-3]WKK77517.2 hypothetical protein QYS49_10425 [Marivirga sp. BDSF4-3]